MSRQCENSRQQRRGGGFQRSSAVEHWVGERMDERNRRASTRHDEAGVPGGELAGLAFPCRIGFAPGQVPRSCGRAPFDGDNGCGGSGTNTHCISASGGAASVPPPSVGKASTDLRRRGDPKARVIAQLLSNLRPVAQSLGAPCRAEPGFLRWACSGLRV